jgi:glycosyltransferase involved in cell wall biosynthesis
MPNSLQLSTREQPRNCTDAPDDRELVKGPTRDHVRVVWTTPHGLTGAGGMDRLTQHVAQAVQSDHLEHIGFVPLTTKGRWGIVAGAFVFALALVRLVLLAKGKGVDLLHINVAAYGSAYRKMILALLARRLGIPYVVHIHAGKFGAFWNEASPPIAAAIDRFLTQSAAIIVLGRDFSHMITDRLPALQSKVHIVYNATPRRRGTTQPAAARAKIQLTSLGLLGPRKNTTGLIAALGRLKDRPDWMATIAGDGEVEKARAQIESLGIADRVSIPGWIDQTSVQALLETTGVFVLPSLSEGLPMAILEAFSYAIPVVATPVNAIPDVVKHEKNGLLVPVGDLDALVAALRRLLEDADLRQALGRQALRDHTERFTFEAYMQRMRVIWQQAAVT